MENTTEQNGVADKINALDAAGEVQGNNVKQYIFTSGRYMTWSGMRIVSTVRVEEDRLTISTFPKRMGKCPVILLDDILTIDISIKIPYLYVMYIICGIAATIFANPLFILLTIFLIWAGMNRKITISQRNGIKAVIYTKDKEAAEAFKEYMKKVTHIS